MSTTVTVTPKTLTASIANNPTKPYDGNSDATLTASNFLLAGLVGTDEITVTKTTGTYNTANVATASMVGTSLAAGDFAPVGSTLLSNYTLPATASGGGHITAQALTASIVGDPTKSYDGNTNATLTAGNFSLSGLVASDTITVTQNSGTYNSASVAAANTVTASLASTDFTAGGTTQLTNYTLPTGAGGPGHITTVTLTIHVTAAGATYTGLAYAGATTCTADGVNSEHPTATLTFVGAGGTTYASSSTPPTDAGSYNAVCSAGGAATDYAAATSAASFTIVKADQAALVLTAPANATYGQTGLSASASGGSGTGIVHYSVNPGSTACTVDGTTGALTITSGTGACQVAARKAGDDNDNPVMSNVVTITIGRASQTITFAQPFTPRTYGETFAVAAATDSRLTVAIGASGGCTIDGSNTVTTVSGTTACVLTASQPGNDNYSAATDVVRTVNAQKKAQIITVTRHAPATAIFGTSFTVGATGGGSGNPVTFSSGSLAVCTNAGGIFTMASGTGACDVQYEQAGDANYSAAIQVVEHTTALKAAQTITFGALGTKTFGDPPFTVSATGGGSGNPVIFSSMTPDVCTTTGTNGSTVTLVAGGSCSVNASQAGNGNYDPAGDVVQSLTIASYNICALYDQTRSVQKNATVLIRLYLCTATGADLSSSSIAVRATGLVRVSTGAAATLEDAGNANPENKFRFDPTVGPSGGYTFNLSTKPLGAGTGTYALQFTAGSDPATHSLMFGVK